MPEEIIKNIFSISVDLGKSPLRVLNAYYIRNPKGRSILIDTGFNFEACKESLFSGLKELGANMANTDILLTHLHSDHTGLAPELAVPGTRIFLCREEIPWMFGQTREDLWAEDNRQLLRLGFPREVVEGFANDAVSRKLSPDPNFTAYLPIDEGDTFVCGDYTLEAVATPGHTPGHMCFWLASEKLMFLGDHVLFNISPNITSWIGMDDALGSYLESLRKIRKYDVALPLPAHRATGNFRARIDELLVHHEQRLDECLGIVQDNPGLSVMDIAGRMSWNIRCKSWEEFPINQKWFAVGEADSHLRHLEVRGRLTVDRSEEVIRYYAN